MSLPLRRCGIVLVLVLQSACTSWQPVAHPLPLDNGFSVTGKARLTDSGGVRHRAIYGASAVGTNARFRRPDWTVDSVPLTSIIRVEVSKADAGATVGVVLLAGLSLFVGFFAVSCWTGAFAC